jgi:hypothetical protein
MSDSPGQLTPVNVVPFVGSNPFGVDVQVSPLSAVIDGGSMEYGTLRIVGPPFSTPDVIPEGTTIPFSVAFVDPASPDTELWEQGGTLIQDTVPPIVESFGVSFNNSMMTASITARDDITSPDAANFWYSFDGVQWQVEPLTGLADPFSGLAINTFQKAFQVPDFQTMQYFFNVQDTVFNNVWFGVKTLNIPEPATITLLVIGILIISGYAWRRQKQTT